ncbi:hypothetical protein QO003_003640 [Arthrobacter silviterrae]|nr:hypothetical protein [Arthrobacter silviterrae]
MTIGGAAPATISAPNPQELHHQTPTQPPNPQELHHQTNNGEVEALTRRSVRSDGDLARV